MRTIEIAACVSRTEESIFRRAVEELERAIGPASPEVTWTCRCIATPAELEFVDRHSVVVVSLLGDAGLEEAWPSTERRLRATFDALAGRDAAVMICTVFRHVGDTDGGAARRLARIRRLNLLAIEISRVTGAFVIDLDRECSAIGAARLSTDYRLGGSVAGEQAAFVLASALAADALDGVVSFEVQDRAAAALAASRPLVDDDDCAERLYMRQRALEVGFGRQRRSAKPTVVTVEASRVDFIVRKILRGAMGPREIGARFAHSVRARGLGKTAKLLVADLGDRVRARK